MGLSASEGRFLCLTARKSNIEFEVQRLTHAKIQLADQMDFVQDEWGYGSNIQHLYYSANGTGGITSDMPRLSYQFVKNKEAFGYDVRVVDQNNRMVVPTLPETFNPDEDTEDRYLIDPNVYQADYFEDKIKYGEWIIQVADPLSEAGWKSMGVTDSPVIYQGTDQEDFARAESEYNADVERLHRIDKRYDAKINQLVSEQKAIETEMESVKKVIDKNIEETFKTFG